MMTDCWLKLGAVNTLKEQEQKAKQRKSSTQKNTQNQKTAWRKVWILHVDWVKFDWWKTFFFSCSVLYRSLLRTFFCSLCYSPDGSCVTACPAGTYNAKQEADGQELGFCLSCDRACSTCTAASPRDCLTCSSGYLRLYQLCLTHCPTG